jgi:hypothetical protein
VRKGKSKSQGQAAVIDVDYHTESQVLRIFFSQFALRVLKS